MSPPPPTEPAAALSSPAPPGPPPEAPVFDRALVILRDRATGAEAPPDRPPVRSLTATAAGPPPPTLPLDPLPARMLNEFVYCPRLFYYEHVEGLFVDNADTVRGAALHRRVDRGKGDLPPPTRTPPAGTPSATSTTEAALDTQEPPASDGQPASEPAAETIHSRSVTLGSDRLGVVAKMDLIESRALPQPGETSDLFAAAEVCPVDYKAGSPREGAETNELWPTDRMQLGVQMLVLRDNGYACREGVIYYRGTRQRVRLPLDAELEAWVRDRIAEARKTAAGPIPPPLDGSPKCVRCSLAPVCLPDETRLLARLGTSDANTPATLSPTSAGTGTTTAPTRPPGPDSDSDSDATPAPGTRTGTGTGTGTRTETGDDPPRRLIAARDDTRALYLNTPGLRVGRSEGVLQVKEKDKTLDEVRISDLHHVALFGNIQLSTQAIHALCDAGIPVTWFSGGGWFYGLTRGHDLKNVFTRIEQFRLARDAPFALAFARRIVHGKIRNQRTLLMRNHVEAPPAALLRLKQAADDALAAGSPGELLGLEGAAAAVYFRHFAGMLKADDPEPGDGGAPAAAAPPPRGARRPLAFDFEGRNRRPPTDPINALLSLAYSLLAKDCTLACYAVGFDPYVGFFHQPRFGRPALALDLMEEFRPLVADSVVLTAVNTGILTPDDFVRAGDAVNLGAPGRKKFFQAYEQRLGSLLTHPVFDYKVSYRRAIELQARLLARVLVGEIPEYLPLTTR
jgi:CRISPR-associated protein Cas1